MNSTTQGLVIISTALFVGLAFMIFILTYMRSHRVRLRDPMNVKSYITDHWVIEKKDSKSGVLYWVSVWGAKVLKTPKPPAAALDVGKKGKKYAEGYKVSEDEIIWITDGGLKTAEIVDEDGKKSIVYKDVDDDGVLKTIDSFKPFGAVPREVIVQQYAKAQEIRNKRWTADKIAGVIQFGFLAIVIIMIILFWQDIWQPVKEMHQDVAAREQRLVQLEQSYTKALSNCQAAQTPKAQTPNVIVQQGSESPPTS